ncbi:hypothetical protein HB900_14570 [Listeria booriae]|uniref:hypothetical protein n=1 Tax=Listeria booriae TaxID=1552123 RepID=UPI0016244F6B|nr:hypothetical protein [Listeria booriae]MBC1575692.1 hypothetical protein [Listeria booriae]
MEREIIVKKIALGHEEIFIINNDLKNLEEKLNDLYALQSNHRTRENDFQRFLYIEKNKVVELLNQKNRLKAITKMGEQRNEMLAGIQRQRVESSLTHISERLVKEIKEIEDEIEIKQGQIYNLNNQIDDWSYALRRLEMN